MFEEAVPDVFRIGGTPRVEASRSTSTGENPVQNRPAYEDTPIRRLLLDGPETPPAIPKMLSSPIPALGTASAYETDVGVDTVIQRPSVIARARTRAPIPRSLCGTRTTIASSTAETRRAGPIRQPPPESSGVRHGRTHEIRTRGPVREFDGTRDRQLPGPPSRRIGITASVSSHPRTDELRFRRLQSRRE